MQQIIVIDYGMGNLHSVKNMVKYLGYDAKISASEKDILTADKLILPGVGNFKKAMSVIKDTGLQEILNEAVLHKKIDTLGICLGMQLLTSYSEEGDCEGLGWIAGSTRKFALNDEKLKVPHMGWNYIDIQQSDYLVDNLDENARFYFVHSYYVTCEERKHCIALTEYGHKFDSVIRMENIVGMQFHPEKSHRFGMKILKNYLEK